MNIKHALGWTVCALVLVACSSKSNPTAVNQYNNNERKVMREHAADAPPPNVLKAN